ncbi:flagellar hook-associated protein FlgK [Thermodesulfovibrio sp.]|jgi:flagellar hook-associated protein 1 FlgK|uniref:flagellar hook-associated protein FlgK n=1 Tax=Thermodesulfovibrio TaxID=28261 RepID=UPI00261589B7|nr:flagellar hook-associated protein FlgK [Thermodesulfovibrio sp.]
MLTALFDIGKTGVLTYQKALEVISHNISNAATEGYTRQDVVFENMSSGILSISGVTGRGVRLKDIRRLYDSFIDLQLKTENSNLAYWDVVYNGMLRLENIFNDASETAFSNVVNDFFNAWQEVSQNPPGAAERTLLLDRAQYLTKRVNLSYKSLIDERSEIYKDTQNLVDQINKYLDQINELNEKIAASPGSLDALDQRDNLVKQLNDIVQINYFTDFAGRYSILLGGMPMVDGGRVYHLRVGLDSNQKMQFNLETESGFIDVTSLIQGGKLKAEIDLRDETIPEYMNKLNMLVFDLTEAINAQHRQGYGLNGSTGYNFFTPLNSLNITSPPVSQVTTGSFTDIKYRVNNPSQAINSTFSIQFNGTSWTVNGNPLSNSNVSSWSEGGNTYYKLSFSGMELVIENPSNNLNFNLQIPSSDISFKINSVNENTYKNYRIQRTGSSWTLYEIDNSTSPPTYININSALTTTPITNGYILSFNGIDVTINNPSNNLDFNFQISPQAAFLFSVAITDTQKIAAAAEDPTGTTSGVMDNRNARAIYALLDKEIIGSSKTIDYYRSIVSNVGVFTSSAKTQKSFQEALVQEIQKRRQDMSGISLDEEAVNLLKYQKMYEASARVIRVADEILASLFEMVR